MSIQAYNFGAHIVPVLGRTPEVITAAAGNDNVEINSDYIDLLAIPNQGNRRFHSALVSIAYDTTLTAAKTLTITANLQTSPVSNFASGNVDVNTPESKVVTLTGKGVFSFDVPLVNVKQYLRLQSTADLSHTGTDTVAISAMIVLGGSDLDPVG